MPAHNTCTCLHTTRVHACAQHVYMPAHTACTQHMNMPAHNTCTCLHLHQKVQVGPSARNTLFDPHTTHERARSRHTLRTCPPTFITKCSLSTSSTSAKAVSAVCSSLCVMAMEASVAHMLGSYGMKVVHTSKLSSWRVLCCVQLFVCHSHEGKCGYRCILALAQLTSSLGSYKAKYSC